MREFLSAAALASLLKTEPVSGDPPGIDDGLSAPKAIEELACDIYRKPRYHTLQQKENKMFLSLCELLGAKVCTLFRARPISRLFGGKIIRSTTASNKRVSHA
jgi:hypothetical protein